MLFCKTVPLVPVPLRRTPTLPDVPTIVQAGLPDFEAVVWLGVLAPANTPRDIVTRLNSEIIKAMKLPDVREKLLAMGADPVGDTPEQFDAHLQKEIAKWARIVKASGARAD